MTVIKQRHRVIIEKFQELLRSGKDYTIEYMCEEVGSIVFLETKSVRQIINRHFKTVITQEMIDFTNNLDNSKRARKNKEIRRNGYQEFSEKFEVCMRESILLSRYIRRRK